MVLKDLTVKGLGKEISQESKGKNVKSEKSQPGLGVPKKVSALIYIYIYTPGSGRNYDPPLHSCQRRPMDASPNDPCHDPLCTSTSTLQLGGEGELREVSKTVGKQMFL